MVDHTSFQDKFVLYEEVIKRYERKYPKEWNSFMSIMKQNRRELTDEKFGSMEEGAFRYVASVPERLDKMLKAACKVHNQEPDYLNKEFFKRFPIFMVAKKI